MQLSNKKIAILGGGQLARLIAFEGKRLGFEFIFWANDSQTSIDGLGERFDASKMSLEAFCNQADAVIIDYEHIDLHEIEVIEKFAPYSGRAELLRVGRDRLNEKHIQEKLNIKLNPYVLINAKNDLFDAKNILEFPFILKKRVQGYDGIGQAQIKNEEDFEKALTNQDLHTNYIAEKFVYFEKEYSLLSVRGKDGAFKSYDLCENIHKNGILVDSKNIKDDKLREQASAINKAIADHCQYVGVFAVEYFYVDNQLIINEISPRVHNSGHWTIDGTVCNQFENHLRACLGFPLGSTESHSEINMMNLIGFFKDNQDILDLPGARIYNYNKAERPNRKIGHVNINRSIAAV